MKSHLLWMFVIYSCSQPQTDKIKVMPPAHSQPVFGVKVVNFYDCKNWAVVFSNDSFRTQTAILEAFDLSMDGIGVDVVQQCAIFEDKQYTITFAKTLKDYKTCIAYNKKVEVLYNKMVSYRKKHPPLPPVKEEVCKEKVEIKIY